MIEVPSTLRKINNGRVQMILRPKSSINAYLNESLGKIKNGQNVYLLFSSSNSTEDDLVYDTPIKITYRKKWSGLSTGGIIAIIIPLELVLLAVVALAFFVRKSPEPPSNNINNVVEVNSSANIVN